MPRSHHKDKPNPKQFQGILKKVVGYIGDPRPKLKPVDIVPPGDVDAEAEYFTVHDQAAHLRDAVRDLGFSIAR